MTAVNEFLLIHGWLRLSSKRTSFPRKHKITKKHVNEDLLSEIKSKLLKDEPVKHNVSGFNNHFVQIGCDTLMSYASNSMSVFNIKDNTVTSTTTSKEVIGIDMNIYNHVAYKGMEIFFGRDTQPIVSMANKQVARIDAKYPGTRPQSSYANTSLSVHTYGDMMYMMTLDYSVVSVDLKKLYALCKSDVADKKYRPTVVVDADPEYPNDELAVCSITGAIYVANRKSVVRVMPKLRNNPKFNIDEHKKCYAMAVVRNVVVVAVSKPKAQTITNKFPIEYIFLNQEVSNNHKTLQESIPKLRKDCNQLFSVPQKITHFDRNYGTVVISLANFTNLDLILLTAGKSMYLRTDYKISGNCHWTILCLSYPDKVDAYLGTMSGIYQITWNI